MAAKFKKRHEGVLIPFYSDLVIVAEQAPKFAVPRIFIRSKLPPIDLGIASSQRMLLNDGFTNIFCYNLITKPQ